MQYEIENISPQKKEGKNRQLIKQKEAEVKRVKRTGTNIENVDIGENLQEFGIKCQGAGI